MPAQAQTWKLRRSVIKLADYAYHQTTTYKPIPTSVEVRKLGHLFDLSTRAFEEVLPCHPPGQTAQNDQGGTDFGLRTPVAIAH